MNLGLHNVSLHRVLLHQSPTHHYDTYSSGSACAGCAKLLMLKLPAAETKLGMAVLGKNLPAALSWETWKLPCSVDGWLVLAILAIPMFSSLILWSIILASKAVMGLLATRLCAMADA